MAGFVRRYTSVPTLDVIKRIEGPVIVDITPAASLTGEGTGAVLVIGEFEDGPFATDLDGITEVLGAPDLEAQFGAFGFSYGSLVSRNPCARRHNGELWNGNGFLKLFKLKCQRLMVARVDTSVGSVGFEPLATIDGGLGLFQVTDGDSLSATTSGTAASDVIAAKVVTVRGKGTTGFATIVGGETVGFKIDGGPQINVVFDSTMITAALCLARINSVLGSVTAVLNGANIDFVSQRKGYAASVELVDVVVGSVAKLGHIAGVFLDVARVYGAATNLPGIAAGDKISLNVDGAGIVIVTFAGTPANAAAAALVINTQVASTVCYVMPGGTLMLQGAEVGLDNGSIAIALGVPDAAADLGFGAGTTLALSNVSDSNGTSVADIVALIAGSSALAAINVSAVTTAAGGLRLVSTVFGVSLLVASGSLAIALGLSPLGVAVEAADHLGGTIPAGTRVRTAGGLEWVTMQTLDIPAGELGPYTAKVRPATDDGTAVGTGVGTVTTIVDAPTFANLKVNNVAALTACLTEGQMDAAYYAAFAATLNEKSDAREANYSLCARRTDALVREGKSNALDATANGLVARKFISRDPLGTTSAQINANVAAFKSDRLFYCGKGLKVLVPQIAAVGAAAGGLGFTDDGIITVAPDGPLATLCAMLAPEENPGQATGLIDDFFEVDSFGETMTRQMYEAFKANGVAVPRMDRQSGMVFQSGDTSASTSAVQSTMARRKMADYIQDTAAEFLGPYTKKLNRQARRDGVVSQWASFMAGLKSELNPELQRIEDFSIDDGVNAGNTPAKMARGVFYVKTVCRTLSSLENIVFITEVGESAIVVREAA